LLRTNCSSHNSFELSSESGQRHLSPRGGICVFPAPECRHFTSTYDCYLQTLNFSALRLIAFSSQLAVRKCFQSVCTAGFGIRTRTVLDASSSLSPIGHSSSITRIVSILLEEPREKDFRVVVRRIVYCFVHYPYLASQLDRGNGSDSGISSNCVAATG
jgi:hypothetical protein